MNSLNLLCCSFLAGVSGNPEMEMSDVGIKSLRWGMRNFLGFPVFLEYRVRGKPEDALRVFPIATNKVHGAGSGQLGLWSFVIAEKGNNS